MLDRLSPQWRHLALLLIAALLAALVDNIGLITSEPIIASLVGAALTALIAWVTPLTRQYGIGSPVSGELVEEPPATDEGRGGYVGDQA